MELHLHKKAFGTVAENYSLYRKHHSQKVYDLLFSLTKDKPAVLDVGCGTGNSTEALVEKASKVVGADHDKAMIAESGRLAEQKKLSIEYVVAPAEKLPFEDNSFDAVISGSAFHWFATNEAVQEIKRVHKTGTPCMIFWLRDEPGAEEDEINPEFFKKYNWQVVPQKLWSQDTIKELLETNGYSNVVATSIPHSETYTLDERVGLETTSSAFALLSPEDKESFVKDITEDLQKKLGSRLHFEIKMQIKVVYGFK
jgi:SAM-dependent methyltransferase